MFLKVSTARRGHEIHRHHDALFSDDTVAPNAIRLLSSKLRSMEKGDGYTPLLKGLEKTNTYVEGDEIRIHLPSAHGTRRSK